eukprot:1258303-Rhodomonas_salina.1
MKCPVLRTVWSYGMRCPVLTQHVLLRASHTVSGTDLACGANNLVHTQYIVIPARYCPRVWCYQPSTDPGYGATSPVLT